MSLIFLKKQLSKNSSKYFSLIMIIGLIMTSACFTLSHLFSFVPCFLCNVQRSIYMSLFLLGFFGLFCWNKKLIKILFWLVVIFLISGIAVASYHSLIQYGFLADPCHKISRIKDSLSFDKLIFDSPTPCSKILLSVFGISVPVYNALIYSSLLIFSLIYKIRLKRF